MHPLHVHPHVHPLTVCIARVLSKGGAADGAVAAPKAAEAAKADGGRRRLLNNHQRAADLEGA